MMLLSKYSILALGRGNMVMVVLVAEVVGGVGVVGDVGDGIGSAGGDVVSGGGSGCWWCWCRYWCW